MESKIRLRESDKAAAEKEKIEEQIKILRDKIGKTCEKLETLENEHGSKLVNEAEIKRLKILKKNYETEVENNKKIDALEKILKNREKYQRKVDRESAKLAEKEKYRNLKEERLNSTKPLEDLK